MNDKVQSVEKIIKEYRKDAPCGIFNTRNTLGDPMCTIFTDGDVSVDICFAYEYFEVFGLSEEEFKEVEDYYNSIRYDEI